MKMRMKMQIVWTFAFVIASAVVVYSTPPTNNEKEELYVPGKHAIVMNRGRLTGEEAEILKKNKLEKESHRRNESVATYKSEQDVLDMSDKYRRFLKRCVRDGELPAITKKMQQFFNDSHLTIEDVEAACERLRQEKRKGRVKRTYIDNTSGKWDRCIIPYVKSTSLPADWGDALDGTHAYYERNTGFRFVEYTENNDALGLTHNNYLNYINGGGCYSNLGNLRGNGQNISPCLGRGTQVHEIGHALGAMHEQKSPVSLDYLSVFYNNIESGKKSQYYRNELDDVYERSKFYDISSTMHYENWGFSINNGITLSSNNPEQEYLIGSDNDFYLFRDLQKFHNCFDFYPSCDPLPVCENGGYATVFEGSCACRCPEGLDPASNCRQIYKPTFPTQWPEGTFTLLKTTLGDCPTGFAEGRMSYTNPSWAWSGGSLHSPGYVNGYTWHQDVCTQTSSSNSGVQWPAGQYCILRYGGSCPSGFEEGLMEAYGNAPLAGGNTGTLPDGTHNAKQQWMMCCRNDGSYSEPVLFPDDSPFILYRQDYWGCQEVEGMAVTGEYYHIKGDVGSSPMFTGSLPYHYRWNDGMFNTYYCAYEPKIDIDCSEIIEFTTEKSYEISTPNYPSNYPANSECTWHFTSPAGTTMMIDFVDFDISNGDDTYCDGYVDLKTYYPGMPAFGVCGSNYLKSHYTLENSLTVKFYGGSTGDKGFNARVNVIEEENKCYNGNGQDGSYTSTLNYTQTFTPCLHWTEVQSCLFGQFDPRSIDFDLNNNYCRNIGTGQMPWCYTNQELCMRENCDPCMKGRCYDLYDDCSDRLSTDPGFCDRNDFGEAHRMCMDTCGRCSMHQEMESKETQRCGPPGDVSCVSPEPMQNDYMIGDVVTYNCPYSSDQRTRICMSDGSWTPLNEVCHGCPSGWSVFNKKCFKWLGWDVLLNQPDATDTCTALGGRLPKVDSSEVKDFLAELVYHNAEDGYYFWLGMTDQGTNNVWTWNDGEPVTYNSWNSGEPNRYRGDCAVGWDTWWSESCSGEENQVICEYVYSDTTVCNDNLPNCMEIVEATSDICIAQSDYAWQNCRSTCAVGDCDFPVQCADEGVTGMGTRITGSSMLNQGEFVEYQCDLGYFHTSGNLKRACLPSGQLTGSKPVCSLPEATQRVELFNDKELFYRSYTSNDWIALSPSAQYASIPYDGNVTEWIFYSLQSAETAFQIWRKTGDSTRYTFLGQNVLTSTDDRAIMVARIPQNEQVQVMAGDLIGVNSKGAIGYSICDESIMPENAPWMISGVSNFDSYQIGTDYEFQTSNRICRIYSIRVTIKPT